MPETPRLDLTKAPQLPPVAPTRFIVIDANDKMIDHSEKVVLLILKALELSDRWVYIQTLSNVARGFNGGIGERAVLSLIEMGYVRENERGELRLTEKGRAVVLSLI